MSVQASGDDVSDQGGERRGEKWANAGNTLMARSAWFLTDWMWHIRERI